MPNQICGFVKVNHDTGKSQKKKKCDLSAIFAIQTTNLSEGCNDIYIEDENDDCTNMLAQNDPIYNIIYNCRSDILKYHEAINELTVK